MNDREITNELTLMRHQLNAVRQQVNSLFDAWESKLDRLIPTKESERQRKLKMMKKEDWKGHMSRNRKHKRRTS